MLASASGAAIGLGLSLALVAGGVAADTRTTPRPAAVVPINWGPVVAALRAEAPTLAPALAAQAVAPHDLDCLTAAVYYEARGEVASGQAAVAQVVLNRVGLPAFAPSVCGVVYQGAHGHGCQFSFACDGEVRRRHDEAAWSQSRQVAARALSGYVMPQVARATYFHVASLGQVWGSRMAPVAHVGHHIFYAPGGRPQYAAYRVLSAETKLAAAPVPAARSPAPAAAPPSAPASLQDTAASAPAQPAAKPTAAS